MKFNFRYCTIVLVIAPLIILAFLNLPKVSGKLVWRNHDVDFNSDFRNYNRILEVFDRRDRKIAKFHIAIANTKEKKAYGLMNLDYLPKDFGMLFTFSPSQVVNMWMKNTLIPLDMIFIDADNEISSIEKNATPHSLDLISSKRQVVMVLEINSGLAKKLRLKVGQKIRILNIK